MKTSISQHLLISLLSLSLLSCEDEEAALILKEKEYALEVEAKRKELNELVRKVDSLETADVSEQLLEAQLKVESLTRVLAQEAEEQASLKIEKEELEEKLKSYRESHPLRSL